jgi:SAM-dependent methyltransferase
MFAARVKRLHADLYRAVAGEIPDARIWHSQWLAQRAVLEGLAEALAGLEGDVLDVGCGSQPYRHMIPGRVTGADIAPGPQVDVVIAPHGPWPFRPASFGGLLCTQVLEHAADFADVLAETARVLRPGGLAVIAAPFLYHEHGSPHDYWRFSSHGLARAVGEHFTVEQVIRQGGIGTLIGTELLAWIDLALAGPVGLVVRGVLFPLLRLIAGVVNLLGAGLDRIDRSGRFYTNVLVVARRAR